MFYRIRNSVLLKTFWFLLGLYFLNISVDCSDANPDNIPEDLTLNDQESIVEMIVEKILGFENAFEEFDDNDNEDHSSKKNNVKIELIFQSSYYSNKYKSFFKTNEQAFLFYQNHVEKGYHQLDTPPPKSKFVF